MEARREFTQYIAARGMVPLERNRHSSRFRIAWYAIVDLLFATRASPKPGFRISGWQCRPIPGSEPVPGGFVLTLRLHRNENRSHLQATLRAHTWFANRPRLVAIASVEDLFDSASWVRCYAVDAYTSNRNREDYELIGVQSYDCTGLELSTCSPKRVGEVPPDAVWLLVDDPAHTPPSENWGNSADIYEAQDDLLDEVDPAMRRQLDEDYRYIRKSIRRGLLGRVILWLLSGPGIFLLNVLSLSPPGAAELPPQDWLASAAPEIAAVWLAIWIMLSGLYLGFLAVHYGMKRVWRWRDGQGCDEERVWRAGTTDSLVFGFMVRRGRVLSGTDWQRFWRSLRPGA